MQDYRMISLRVNEVFNYLHSNEEVGLRPWRESGREMFICIQNCVLTVL